MSAQSPTGKPRRTLAEREANYRRHLSIETMDARLLGQEKDLLKQQKEKPGEDPPPYTSQSASVSAAAAASLPSPPLSNHTVPPASLPSFSKKDFEPSPLELPTMVQCMTHLKLLHTFARLRHQVGNRDGLFGIWDLPNETGGELAERIREKRWTIYVHVAVHRYSFWYSTTSSHSKQFPSAPRMQDYDTSAATTSFLPARPDQFPTHGYGLQWVSHEDGRSLLPPLDVLMVWHAHMLNPRIYLEDCMRMSKHSLWHTQFPWETIHGAIDGDTFEYQHRQWDEWIDKASAVNAMPLKCPRCLTRLSVPWTRPPSKDATTVERMEAYLEFDTGFAGEAFREACPSCKLIFIHPTLRVAKFVTDVEKVRVESVPLPGTILGARGVPQMTEKSKKIGTHDPFFPNRVVKTLEEEFGVDVLRRQVQDLTVEDLKKRFERAMSDKTLISRVNSEQYASDKVFKESKIAVRKVLSHYWDNSCPFGIDLVGAVIRQGSFVHKMRKIDWLHSPAWRNTMQRAIVKYHRFTRIVAENPRKVAVPTLDVDLAWHTHQLTPRLYYDYSVSETKKFLNHSDKIPEDTLHTSFVWTSRCYEVKYGTPYAECTCWYCECIREPLRSSLSNTVLSLPGVPDGSKRGYSVEMMAQTERCANKDPDLGAHVSSHDAVKTAVRSRASWAQQRRSELEALDLQYAKVCKRWEKFQKKQEKKGKGKGKEKEKSGPPGRESDAYLYSPYGYPIMYPYPIYVPYYAEPTCEGDRYTSAGGGGGGGACGSCAAGTCAPSASLGSCASSTGGPSCAASCGGHGDAGGGCGSCGGDGGGGCGGGCGG